MSMSEKIKSTPWGIIIQASLILVTGSMAFANLRAYSTQTRESLNEHKATDDKKWEKNYEDIRDIQSDIEHVKDIQIEVRLSVKEQQTQYSNILRQLEQLNQKIDGLEVDNGNE